MSLGRYETVNYGRSRDREPILNSQKHIERAIPRLLFPEEIRSFKRLATAMMSGVIALDDIGYG